jgi:DNA invertase Pin-like site-specific DNA recombinase
MSWGTHCPHCKQKYPLGLVEKARELRIERLKRSQAARRARGEHVGRPWGIPTEEVVKLRNKGFSMRKIASELCISLGSVQAHVKRATAALAVAKDEKK